ncbi:MAG: hypothetical protein AAGD07_25655, partial [Planctomycetota bacterium]
AAVNVAQQAPVAAPPTVTTAPAVQPAPPLLPPQLTPVGQTIASNASQTSTGIAPQAQLTVAAALTQEQLSQVANEVSRVLMARSQQQSDRDLERMSEDFHQSWPRSNYRSYVARMEYEHIEDDQDDIDESTIPEEVIDFHGPILDDYAIDYDALESEWVASDGPDVFYGNGDVERSPLSHCCVHESTPIDETPAAHVHAARNNAQLADQAGQLVHVPMVFLRLDGSTSSIKVAIVDSCADISVVSREKADEWKREHLVIASGPVSPRNLTGVGDDRDNRILEYIVVLARFESHTCHVPFMVAEHTAKLTILGTPFAFMAGLVVDFTRYQVRVHNPYISYDKDRNGRPVVCIQQPRISRLR